MLLASKARRRRPAKAAGCDALPIRDPFREGAESHVFPAFLRQCVIGFGNDNMLERARIPESIHVVLDLRMRHYGVKLGFEHEDIASEVGGCSQRDAVGGAESLPPER